MGTILNSGVDASKLVGLYLDWIGLGQLRTLGGYVVAVEPVHAGKGGVAPH